MRPRAVKGRPYYGKYCCEFCKAVHLLIRLDLLEIGKRRLQFAHWNGNRQQRARFPILYQLERTGFRLTLIVLLAVLFRNFKRFQPRERFNGIHHRRA